MQGSVLGVNADRKIKYNPPFKFMKQWEVMLFN